MRCVPCQVASAKEAAESEAKSLGQRRSWISRAREEGEEAVEDRAAWSGQRAERAQAETQTVPRGSLLLLLADLRFLSSILSCNHEFILLKIT